MLLVKTNFQAFLTLRYAGLGVQSGVVNRVGQTVNDTYYWLDVLYGSWWGSVGISFL